MATVLELFGRCVCGCGRKTYPGRPGGVPRKHYPGHGGRLKTELCAVKTCKRPTERDIYCNAHYLRVRTHGDPQEGRPITVRKGSYIDNRGYVRIPANGHPNGHKNGSMLEHIKVMAEAIGRPLFPDETVHHKNGVRHDNRPENLELWSGRHPKGARVVDQIRWAKAVLARYGEDESTWLNFL